MTDGIYPILTDYYFGMTVKCKVENISLKLVFANVFQSEVGPHQNMVLSVYSPPIDRYLILAAFDNITCASEPDISDYVRRVFANTPITLEQYGFDNYYYVGDNHGTANNPIELNLEMGMKRGITARLRRDFQINLPYDRLPPDLFPGWPSMGDRSFLLKKFELNFEVVPFPPAQTSLVSPDIALALKPELIFPFKLEAIIATLNGLGGLYNSGYTIRDISCSERSPITVVSGDMTILYDHVGIHRVLPLAVQIFGYRTVTSPTRTRSLPKAERDALKTFKEPKQTTDQKPLF